MTQRYGILARAYFIYGCPGETRATIQETIDLMLEIKPLGAIFYILDLFPGTALYADMQRRLNCTDDIWLERVEDIMYFETDPNLSSDRILEFGRDLRASFYRNLPGFAEDLDLVDEREFYPLHADFFSRLAMTFDQGDYSRVEEIPDKPATSRKTLPPGARLPPRCTGLPRARDPESESRPLCGVCGDPGRRAVAFPRG